MPLILSILIPTYNRKTQLCRALSSIVSQIDGNLASKVQVIVSDNNSTDGTLNDLNAFAEQITIYSQVENIGAERNYAFLMANSSARFKWIFGSDDVLLDGALPIIVSTLELYPNLGLLHLQGVGRPTPSVNLSLINKGLLLELDPGRFVVRVSYMITFLTANIFNSDLLPSEYSTADGIGTQLMQLYPYLYAIRTSSCNGVLRGRFYSAQTCNLLFGYRQLEVFGPNLLKIFSFFISFGFPQDCFAAVASRMCVSYYPHCIAALSKTNPSRTSFDQKAFSLLYTPYKTNIWFWLSCAPVFVFGPIALLYTRALSKVYSVYSHIRQCIHAF